MQCANTQNAMSAANMKTIEHLPYKFSLKAAKQQILSNTNTESTGKEHHHD
jgi:hypothetical protein